MSVHVACRALVAALAAGGVRDVCVSPGSRSTPLALAFADEPALRVFVHLDERSSGFFGLGLAKAARRPAALLCTSGTAAAEFLPAVIEAHYARVPLVVLTADRPAELRDAGAGQTIDQVKLYGPYARWSFELDGPPEERYFAWVGARAAAAAMSSPRGVAHLNVPLREPLVPASAVPRPTASAVAVHEAPFGAPDAPTVARLAADLGSIERGLIVCGPHDGEAEFARAIARLGRTLGWPVLADAASQLRTTPGVRPLAAFDALLRDSAFAESHAPDAVLRFGATPTSKSLGGLLARPAIARHVLVDPDRAWNDPAHRATEILRADDAATCAALADALTPRAESEWLASWLRADARAGRAIEAALAASDELSECRAVTELAEVVPDGATLYVGNSMPIRDLDSFLPAEKRRLRVLANRGANGIDGFLSSGLGAAAVADGPLVVVIGDLALQHDLGGLAAVRQHGIRATILLLNNDGGGIFSFLGQAGLSEERFERLFGTPQGLDFAQAAALFGVAHRRIGGWDAFRTALRASLAGPGTSIVEVPTERRRNVELHGAVWAAVAETTRRAA